MPMDTKNMTSDTKNRAPSGAEGAGVKGVVSAGVVSGVERVVSDDFDSDIDVRGAGGDADAGDAGVGAAVSAGVGARAVADVGADCDTDVGARVGVGVCAATGNTGVEGVVDAAVNASVDAFVGAGVDDGCDSGVGTGANAGVGRGCRGRVCRSPCFGGPEGAAERVAVQELQEWLYLVLPSLAAEC